MKTQPGNLFAGVPSDRAEELVQILLSTDVMRVERIVSHGHGSPPDFWYDQDQHEWVIVLKGAAKVRFDDGGDVMEMNPGDFVNIPVHQKHRVEWTTPDEPTIWLAVFYE